MNETKLRSSYFLLYSLRFLSPLRLWGYPRFQLDPELAQVTDEDAP